MAKMIKFDLSIGGSKVKSFEELQDSLHADLLGYLKSGKLAKWFLSRELADKADMTQAIDVNQSDLALMVALCEVLELEADEDILEELLAQAMVVATSAVVTTAVAQAEEEEDDTPVEPNNMSLPYELNSVEIQKQLDNYADDALNALAKYEKTLNNIQENIEQLLLTNKPKYILMWSALSKDRSISSAKLLHKHELRTLIFRKQFLTMLKTEAEFKIVPTEAMMSYEQLRLKSNPTFTLPNCNIDWNSCIEEKYSYKIEIEKIIQAMQDYEKVLFYFYFPIYAYKDNPYLQERHLSSPGFLIIKAINSGNPIYHEKKRILDFKKELFLEIINWIEKQSDNRMQIFNGFKSGKSVDTYVNAKMIDKSITDYYSLTEFYRFRSSFVI